MGYKIDPAVRVVLLSMVRVVEENRLKWQANIAGCKRDGIDPGDNASVKESFAHFAATKTVVLHGCAIALIKVDLPRLKWESEGEASGRHMVALYDELHREVARY